MTVLLAINSKYVHTLLSVRYLKNYLNDVFVYETNVNVSKAKVLNDLFKLSPQVIAISCYIFNIGYVKSLIEDLRVIMPDVKIVIGGYEADGIADFDNRHIIYGEGENVISSAVRGCEKEYNGINIENLDEIISPYDEEYITLGKNKILYFESSRGCPFSCSYCMSANQKVRNFSLPRVFSDLNKIVKGNVMQIKFVDRTFNADLQRAEDIFSYIIKNYSGVNTNFHFEMAPELFNDKTFEILSKAPSGLMQFEIGVQSFNPQALIACNRKMNIDKVESNISRLVSMKNIHIHTDLIAGLPHEDLFSFKKSFNRLYELKSDMLQLGFLKLLPHSRLKEDAQQFGYKSFISAPYEIAESKWLSYCDLRRLKTAELALDRYYNSGKYKKSLQFILSFVESPYDFYEEFGNFLLENNAFEGGISALRSHDLLFEFSKKFAPEHKLICLLNDDYASAGNVRKWRRNI